MPMGAFNVWRIQSGDAVIARYERDWYHAAIVGSLNQTVIISCAGSDRKGRYVDNRPDARPTLWVVDQEGIRPMQRNCGGFSGF